MSTLRLETEWLPARGKQHRFAANSARVLCICGEASLLGPTAPDPTLPLCFSCYHQLRMLLNPQKYPRPSRWSTEGISIL